MFVMKFVVLGMSHRDVSLYLPPIAALLPVRLRPRGEIKMKLLIYAFAVDTHSYYLFINVVRIELTFLLI